MRVTTAQIKHLIHESNLIEGYDDSEHDKQGLVAWRYLLELDFKSLTAHDIRKIQKIVTLPQSIQPNWRGYYRTERLVAGNDITTAPEHVSRAIDFWLQTYQFTHPHTAHVEFEKIHPFVDGNGRTGRLIMWWMQLRRKEKLTEITLAGREEYLAWFN